MKLHDKNYYDTEYLERLKTFSNKQLLELKKERLLDLQSSKHCKRVYNYWLYGLEMIEYEINRRKPKTNDTTAKVR